jgi:tetratricopeptide (TPR) repeat protein
MWDDFLFTIRKQELGANAFHSLSLRLMAAGESNEAIVNAKKATELYRELVALVPRHLPTLAKSLQNLASILWNVGHQEEAIVACEEGVGIMRELVDPERYFLPALADMLDSLAGYLTEKGDLNSASAAMIESTEVRRKFASLPPEPDFLFEKIEIELHDKDAELSSETASEADEEYHDSTEDLMEVEVVLSEAVPSIIPEPQPLGPASMDRTSPVKTLDKAQSVTDIAIPAKISLAEILRTPLEVRLSMRSSLMDILWWILTGILFAIVCSRVV